MAAVCLQKILFRPSLLGAVVSTLLLQVLIFLWMFSDVLRKYRFPRVFWTCFLRICWFSFGIWTLFEEQIDFQLFFNLCCRVDKIMVHPSCKFSRRLPLIQNLHWVKYLFKYHWSVFFVIPDDLGTWSRWAWRWHSRPPRRSRMQRCHSQLFRSWRSCIRRPGKFCEGVITSVDCKWKPVGMLLEQCNCRGLRAFEVPRDKSDSGEESIRFHCP